LQHFVLPRAAKFSRQDSAAEEPGDSLTGTAHVEDDVLQKMVKHSVVGTGHRRSAMRAYGTCGAVVLSKGDVAMDIARAFPGVYYTFHMMQTQRTGAHAELRQFIACSALPLLASHGRLANAVVGGWSHGATFAYNTAMELETCMGGLRAVFALDPRTLQPQFLEWMPPAETRLDWVLGSLMSQRNGAEVKT
jgi:hypothetical protein